LPRHPKNGGAGSFHGRVRRRRKPIRGPGSMPDVIGGHFSPNFRTCFFWPRQSAWGGNIRWDFRDFGGVAFNSFNAPPLRKERVWDTMKQRDSARALVEEDSGADPLCRGWSGRGTTIDCARARGPSGKTRRERVPPGLGSAGTSPGNGGDDEQTWGGGHSARRSSEFTVEISGARAWGILARGVGKPKFRNKRVEHFPEKRAARGRGFPGKKIAPSRILTGGGM